MERAPCELPLTTQCDLLTLHRSGVYYQPTPPSPEEVAIKHRIDAIYAEHQFYGSRKIAKAMRPDLIVNRKAVQRHMREMGLVALVPGPHLSKPHPDHQIYPYLLRNLKITAVNQVWSIDITYIRLQSAWMYLVAILDWFSRFVVSWKLAQTLEISFVVNALTRALTGATPQIMNSDQGSHFTSPHYLEPLLQKQVAISMDGRGRALDNIFTERLWRTVKYEEVYLREYGSPKEARHGLTRYFDFYNYTRIHQVLDYRTPAEVYFN